MLKKLIERLTVREEDLPQVQSLLAILIRWVAVITVIPMAITLLQLILNQRISYWAISGPALLGAMLGLQRLNKEGRINLAANLFLTAVLLFAAATDSLSSSVVKSSLIVYLAIPPIAALLLPAEASFVWSGLATAAIVIRALIFGAISDEAINYTQLVLSIVALQAITTIAWFSSRTFHQTKSSLQRQIQQGQAGIEIGHTITSALDAPLVVRQAVHLIRDAFGYYHVGLFLLDPDGESITLMDAAGENAARLKERGLHIPLDSTAAVAIAINEKRRCTVTSWEESTDASGRPIQFTYGTQARLAIPARVELVIPLLVRDRALGALDILSLELDLFPDEDVHTLEGLVGHIANAIDHARLFEETQRRAAQEAVLSEVGRQISATLDLPTVLERIARQAHDAIGVTTSAVFLRQPDHQTFRAIIAIGHLADEVKVSTFESGKSILGDLARRGVPEIVNGVEQDPRTAQLSGTPPRPGENLLAAPLMVRGQVVGVAAVWRTERQGPFNQEELAFLVRLSDQAAIAIENARLFEEIQRRAAQEATLGEMGRVLTTMLNVDMVVENVYHYTSRLMDTANFYIGLYNEEKETLSFTLYIENNERLNVSDEWPLGMGLISQIVRTGEPIVTNDYTTECIRRGITPGGRVSYAWMGVPLRAADRVIGVMNVSSFDPQIVYTPEQERIFSAIADQTAIAIQNARLFEQIQLRSVQLQTAAEVSQAITSILDPDKLMQQVVELVRERFELYYAGLFIVGQTSDQANKWAVLRAGTGEAGRKLMAQGHKLQVGGNSMIGQCVANKEAYVALDVGQEAVYFENPLLPETRSEMALPLVSRGEAIGALTIQSTRQAAFSEEDIAVLQTMADQLAIALDNARFFRATQEALEAAKQADQAKSTFLATMSHELRTPLNGILGYAQILKRDSTLTQRQLDGLNIIEQSGEHLLTLINDILDMAKIEAGRIDLYKEDFDLRTFLNGISEMIRVRAEEKSLLFYTEFTLNGTGEGPPAVGVHGDERRLRQVLINLLGNAVKFTDAGGVTFRVTKINAGDSSSPPTGEPVFRFEIEDTGIGLSPEELNVIFEPFRQVGDQRRRKGGTGLGLAISRNLIELMESTLQVKSTLGQGTTFWFDLALPVVAGWVAPHPAEERQIVGIKGLAPSILVVDDNVPNRTVIVELLAPLGFHVLEAGNGHEGLAQATQHRPDAVITDLVMPGMNGLELVRRLRQAPSLKDIAVIAISASAYEEDREQSLAAGSDTFVRKPVEANILFAELQRLLNLEWVYMDEEPPAEPDVTSTPPLALPRPEELAALAQLAVLGDVRAIQRRADELERSDERLQPFADELRQLAKGFQIDKIRNLLKPYQKPSADE